MKIRLKKTEHERENANRQEHKRKRIMEIRCLLDEKHYSVRATAIALGISRNTVRRVREGEIELLVQSHSNTHSRLDPYFSEIMEWLNQGKQFIEIRVLLQQYFGVAMGKSQVSAYCAEIRHINAITLPKLVAGHYVSRQNVLQHIWSRKEFPEKDWEAICLKYPNLPLLDMIIKEFRTALKNKDVDQLTRWTEHYGSSSFSHFNSFIKGLKRDWEAVKNGFTYPYNSGFVEGTVNKLKTEKRMMYGRAGYALLRAKLLGLYYQKKAV